MLTPEDHEFLRKFHHAITYARAQGFGTEIRRVEMSLRNYEVCKRIISQVGPARWWRYTPEMDTLNDLRTELCVLYELGDDGIYVVFE